MFSTALLYSSPSPQTTCFATSPTAGPRLMMGDSSRTARAYHMFLASSRSLIAGEPDSRGRCSAVDVAGEAGERR